MSTGSYAKHQDLISRFKVLAQQEIPKSRTFDRTVGCFKTMNGNRIQINRAGMADCYMMIPTKYGVIMLELEFKTGKSKQSKHQKVWQKFIESMGGFYLIVRDEQEAVIKIKEHLSEKGLM